MNKSIVWNFFKKCEAGQDFALCKICSRSVKNKGGNTSNLIQHLKRSHPSKYGTMTPSGRKSAAQPDSSAQSRTQPTAKSLFVSSKPLPPCGKRHESTDRCIPRKRSVSIFPQKFQCVSIFLITFPLKFYKEVFAKKIGFSGFLVFFWTVFGFYPEPPNPIVEDG